MGAVICWAGRDKDDERHGYRGSNPHVLKIETDWSEHHDFFVGV